MMMMGKRGGRKNPMRRTTSMTEFAPPVDVLVGGRVADEAEAEAEADEATELEVSGGGEVEEEDAAVEEASYGWFGAGADGAGVRADWLAAYRARAAPALAGLRRNSADFSAVETAAFLRACGLCNRRLGPGRDTFMYKYVEIKNRKCLSPDQRSMADSIDLFVFVSAGATRRSAAWSAGNSTSRTRSGRRSAPSPSPRRRRRRRNRRRPCRTRRPPAPTTPPEARSPRPDEAAHIDIAAAAAIKLLLAPTQR
jgi:hypothetical protein